MIAAGIVAAVALNSLGIGFVVNKLMDRSVARYDAREKLAGERGVQASSQVV